ncbi:unnamed protein product [Brassica rapa]|uniref:Uncharacterized protein n=1 Tax=Brassica campestris TaxID=3711 RepID=A0A8D9HYX6_BRACM|nr:unnamed protein product [Brassica rapa]
MSQSSYSEKSLRQNKLKCLDKSNNGTEEMCRDQCNWAINGMIPHQTQYNTPAGDPGIGLEQLELMCKV